MNTTKIDTAAASSGASDVTRILRLVDSLDGYLTSPQQVELHDELLAAIRGLAAPAPVVPAEPELRWDGPHPLQIDSYATGQQRIYSSVVNGEIWLEVTDGSDWWRARFPAPWERPAAPSRIDADKLHREMPAEPLSIPEVHQAIRDAGGIVHSDGNIFFTRAEQFIAAAVLCREEFDARHAAAELVSDALGGATEGSSAKQEMA